MNFLIEHWLIDLKKELEEEKKCIYSHWISSDKNKIPYSELSIQDIEKNIELIKQFNFKLNYLPFLENELRKRKKDSMRSKGKINISMQYINSFKELKNK